MLVFVAHYTVFIKLCFTTGSPVVFLTKPFSQANACQLPLAGTPKECSLCADGYVCLYYSPPPVSPTLSPSRSRGSSDHLRWERKVKK